jgi:hypothetical protein
VVYSPREAAEHQGREKITLPHTALEPLVPYVVPAEPLGLVQALRRARLRHALESGFYSGLSKEAAMDLGLEYLRNVPDFEINFGRAKSRKERKKKRESMEREYLQAIFFYLENPPQYTVVGIEVKGSAEVPGLPLPLKAVSDLVVESRGHKGALDIVDHKFVDSFSPQGAEKTLFIVQAIFNYYTVREMYKKDVKRFILHECKKRRNADGSPQMRRYVIEFEKCAAEFEVFRRLIRDATSQMVNTKVFLPNPSDMFEGENSFDIYRLGLIGE